ncbi:hypothetical protein NE865_07736 [Phthorimaea operculella]|nr:hypothetical protein NE865_07736 [Phthorimaea operculella]
MIARLCVVCLLVFLKTSAQTSHENENLPLNEQVKLLKFIIKDELKDKLKKPAHKELRHGIAGEAFLHENVEYVDLSQVQITPINEKDRKDEARFKLRQLATTPSAATTLWTRKNKWHIHKQFLRENVDEMNVPTPTTIPPLKLFNPISDDNIAKLNIGKKEAIRSPNEGSPSMTRELGTENAIEIFYNSSMPEADTTAIVSTENVTKEFSGAYEARHRRLLYTDKKRAVEHNWIHCEELITPYLNGMKGELKVPYFLYENSTTVQRLFQLLKTPIPKEVHKPDIISLLYQISNVQIRLFHWSSRAIKPLFNIITEGGPHTYKNLKKGIRRLFKSWHIDFSNTTNLLAQSKVFRPPCVYQPQEALRDCFGPPSVLSSGKMSCPSPP